MRLDNLNAFKDDYYDICKNISEIAKMTAQDILDLYGLEANLSNALNPSTSTKTIRTWYTTLDGTAPSGAKIGDKILTGGGTYQIVEAGTEGAKYNSATGLWSKKIDDIKTDINESNAGTIRNTEVIEYANSRITTATSSVYDNSVSTDVNTKAIDEQTEVLGDLPSQIADETSDAIQVGIENSGIVEALDDYVIGADGGSGLKDDEIVINQESMLKGLEQLKNTVGENSDTYKAALDHYNSFYGEKGTTFYGINAQSPGYSSGKTFANFEEFFASFNATNKGNGFWEYIDEHGHTTAKTYDSFINDYVLSRPSGYTDREHALSTINKAIETGYIEDLKEHYGNYYTRLLDTINTPEGGDRALTTAVREETERAIRQILNSKNNPDKLVGGSYDSTGKKVISVSINKDDEIVDIGYSKLAADLSAHVDNLSEMPSAEDIYNHDIYKQIYGYSTDPNNEYYYDPSRDGNVDQVRAYDSSYNKEFESLKISTNKNANETRTNSEMLMDNTDAMNDLSATFGEEMAGLKEAADGVVEVIDKLGNTIGTIDTKSGSIYKNGSSGSKTSLSSSSNSDRTYSDDGTYGNYYSDADISAIKTAQDAYNKAKADNDTVKMEAAHNAANAIRDKYGDKSGSDGVIVSSNDKGNVVVVTKKKYAKGTKSAPRGVANIDELGEELIIRSPEKGRYTYLEKGDGVVPADLTNTLMSFAKDPTGYMLNVINNKLYDPILNKDIFGLGNSITENGKVVNNGDTVNEYHFEKLELVCPNIVDGQSLMAELQTLTSKAVQRANKR